MNSVAESDFDELDELLDEFDDRWSVEKRGAECIFEFLTTAGWTKPFDARSIIELVQIDLERSWMAWDKGLNESAVSKSPTDLLSLFSQLPQLRDYQAAFRQEAVICEEQWREVAICEMEARNEWGDAIGSLHFQHLYGISVPDDRLHSPCFLQSILSQTGNEVREKLPIRGLSIVGRQRSSDHLEYFAESLPSGNRLVIANRREAQISREQFSIQLLNPKVAVVQNLSSVNPIAIRKDQLLEPNESAVITLPCAIAVADRRLLLT